MEILLNETQLPSLLLILHMPSSRGVTSILWKHKVQALRPALEWSGFYIEAA